MKRKIVALWWLGTLLPCFQLIAQIARFHFEEDRMVVEDRSGRKHVLPAAGVDRKSVRVSPDGSRLIWHLDFAGYGHDPRIPVRLWSLSRPDKIVEYQVPTYSRYLETVEWIDLRRVLIAGDRYGVVLDADGGQALKGLSGNLFAISPDRRAIAFWEAKGIGHPFHDSDRVSLALLKETLPEPGPDVVEVTSGVYRVHPPDHELKSNELARDVDLSHRAWSTLQWFSDSQRLAFIEWHNRGVWLVVLKLSKDRGTLVVDHEGFVLPVPDPVRIVSVSDLLWTKQDEELVYVHKGQRLIVNLASRSAKWETPQ